MNEYTPCIQALFDKGIALAEVLDDVLRLVIIDRDNKVLKPLVEMIVQWRTHDRDDVSDIRFGQGILAAHR